MASCQTILHPTDFSRCAAKALEMACSLARDCGGQVFVLHVLETVRLAAGRLSVELFSPPKSDRWEARYPLRARQPDVWIELAMRKGTPAEAILDLAREIPCDVIVMGMQGHAGEGLSRLGTVATEVARLAACPVVGAKLPLTETSCLNDDNQSRATNRPGQAGLALE